MLNMLKRKITEKMALAGVMGLAALLCLFPLALHAEKVPDTVVYSPDITAVLGGVTVNDEDVAKDDMAGLVTMLDVGTIPNFTDVNACHAERIGAQLLSFDTTVSLPGGLIAGPGDVVRFDGITYTVEFDAVANGLPNGVIIDAVSVGNNNDLLLSFDTTVALDGITVEDEDLVRFNGTTFSLFFDGSDAGVPAALDLDGAYLNCNGSLLLSFDGSAMIDGMAFDDEDVLLYDPASDTWVIAYNGSAQHTGWIAADLNALCSISFQMVNSELTGTPDPSTFSFDPTPVPEGPAGTFSFSADFCNIGDKTLSGLKSVTVLLSGNNALLNRDSGTPRGVGSELTFPESGGFADSKLEPGECVRVDYKIGLGKRVSFQFFTDVFGFRQ